MRNLPEYETGARGTPLSLPRPVTCGVATYRHFELIAEAKKNEPPR